MPIPDLHVAVLIAFVALAAIGMIRLRFFG